MFMCERAECLDWQSEGFRAPIVCVCVWLEVESWIAAEIIFTHYFPHPQPLKTPPPQLSPS